MLAEAKRHLQLADLDTAHDDWIEAVLPAIRREAEARTMRALLPQKWRLSMDSFPVRFDLMPAPVTAVLAVEYVDSTGTTIALTEGTDYQVDLESQIARVLPFYGMCWPVPRCETANAVQVTFAAGYADAAAVPAGIKHWILVRLADMFAHRGEESQGQTFQAPAYTDSLLDPYRVIVW
jgi:uncharacterized phiE125 gp8 family phage protein